MASTPLAAKLDAGASTDFVLAATGILHVTHPAGDFHMHFRQAMNSSSAGSSSVRVVGQQNS